MDFHISHRGEGNDGHVQGVERRPPLYELIAAHPGKKDHHKGDHYRFQSFGYHRKTPIAVIITEIYICVKERNGTPAGKLAGRDNIPQRAKIKNKKAKIKSSIILIFFFFIFAFFCSVGYYIRRDLKLWLVS